MTGPAPERPILFESGGVVLIIGASEQALPVAQELAGSLKVVAALTDSCLDSAVPAGVDVINGRVTELSGHLGEFTALGAVPDGSADLGPLSPNDTGFYDLVFDFSDPPLLKAEVSPYGYYAAARNKNILTRALAEAPRLVGRFSKQKYFRYDPMICAHSSKGVQGCTRCLSSCPADAISVAAERVQVDAFLCRGCGTCTLVCPTGALSYVHQDSVPPLQQARQAIHQARNSDEDPLHVVLHGSDIDADKLEHWLQQEDKPVLPVTCKVVASTGMETWLGILSLGNISLTLLVDKQLPALTFSALRDELTGIRDLLQAMGNDPDVIVMCNIDEADSPSTPSVFTEEADRRQDMETGHAGVGKKELVWQAIDGLKAQAGSTRHEAALPEGASFGAVRVNDECTLCHACSKLCPTNAIQRSADMQQLLFTEARCVQCGLCQQGCPENALTLVPRLMLDASMREEAQLLHEGSIAACIKCGAPIMSQALLDSGFKHVKNHPLFQGEGAKVFKLCTSCRIEATALDQVLPGELTNVM